MPEYWVRRAITVLVTPVGLALISAVRLLIISNYNVTTAITVAESGGYVNTFLGSLIPLVPVFMPYLALILFAFRRFLLCAMAIAATVLISPVNRPQVTDLRYFDDAWTRTFHWISLNIPMAAGITIGVWMLSLVVPWRAIRGHWTHSVFHGVWACVVLFALLPYLFSAYHAPNTANFYEVYLRQPWLTAQQIAVNPGHVYQGYVLSSDDQWMTVLLYQSRTIAYFRADSVTGRVVCTVPSKPTPGPLVRLLDAQSPHLPGCLSLDSWTVAKKGVQVVHAKKPQAPAKEPARAVTNVPAAVKAPACCRPQAGRWPNEPPHRPNSTRPAWPPGLHAPPSWFQLPHRSRFQLPHGTRFQLPHRTSFQSPHPAARIPAIQRADRPGG